MTAEERLDALYRAGCRCRDGHTIHPPCNRCFVKAFNAHAAEVLEKAADEVDTIDAEVWSWRIADKLRAMAATLRPGEAGK